MDKMYRVEDGDENPFFYKEDINRFVDLYESVRNALGDANIGVKVSSDKIKFFWKGGEITGSVTGSATEINVRGHWNASTNYNKGDIVFLDTIDYQKNLQSNTYISLIDGNENHEPPSITASYADDYWQTMAINSFPSLAISNPAIEDPDKRLTTFVPGDGLFYYSGSMGTSEGGTRDQTQIVGGVVTVGGRVMITGPLHIQFQDDTTVVIDTGDMEQLSNDLNGKEFKLREYPYCDDGVSRWIGILATEPYDK